ncbi:glycosyltransferase [Puniceicoccales bacterium CK1056]|uniref:Glycosyltransferase n=1 Tax=Oceanipulchritudo coccoides TaxID=2706888 RepID=A0A6B2M0L2_9BACT|nr:glycosyltransferase family 2 protein [Oceanipulchritudo coccoides]NDV62448.1 glycosyltransferase [Oceanipulchritudo coccoides]
MSPSVSVITVCRNALKDLRKTADSVFLQSADDFEWIIVDGASTDGTGEFLETLDQPWIHTISEPDEGIYDAMNKGLAKASGEWVWFMNAGDCFHDQSSVQKVAQADSNLDICFGESLVYDGKGNNLGPRSYVTPHALPEFLERSQFTHGMVVSHQAFVVKRRLVPTFAHPRYRFSADLDWMLRILAEPRNSVNLGTLARIDRDGATLQNWEQSQYERFLILARHFGTVPTLINHCTILLRRLLHGKRTKLWK